jgi:very-short-patch-repair endonuclease
MVASRRWLYVLGDVLVPAGTPVTERRRLRAAVLATGGLVSHESAARLWGFPAPRDRDPRVHVTVERADHPRVAGVRLHRRRLLSGDRSWVEGIDLTSRARTLADCLLTWSESDGADLVDHVLRVGLFDAAALRRMAIASRGLHGIAGMSAIIERASAGAWSAAERRLHQVLRVAGIVGWVANHRLEIAGGLSAIVDVWFPSARVAIEVDGQAWHVSRERFQSDRSRQNALVLAGCTVLRFTWNDIEYASDRVVGEVRRAVAASSAS